MHVLTLFGGRRCTKLGILPDEEVTMEHEFGILQTQKFRCLLSDSRIFEFV